MKRMLAYSSIAHSGYILIGIVVAISKSPEKAMASVIFYLLIYTIMTLGTFGLISLYKKTETSTLLVDDLKGLSQRRPGLALGLTVMLLSVAGIPPLAGFFGKFYLFSTAITEGLFWPVVWGVLGSVIGVVYYLRPVVNMYMFAPQSHFDEPLKYGPTRVVFVLSALAVLVLGIASSPILTKVRLLLSPLFK